MKNALYLIFLSIFLFGGTDIFSQIRRPNNPRYPGNGRTGGTDQNIDERLRPKEKPKPVSTDALLDSMRKKDENREDSVIYTARFIRYTNIGTLRDSTKVLPLDTSILNFQNYSPIRQPERPTINLGALGLAARDMLFNPSKAIGFDPGFHTLDAYLLTQDSLRYYRARAPFTDLYYVNGGGKDQLFKVIHSQNIKPNWNFGANYFRNGSENFYRNQKANHLNAAVFTWYESKNRRYNLLINGIFNTLKAQENGGVIDDDLFNKKESLGKTAFQTRLDASGKNTALHTWKQKNFFLRQSYYIGRIDTLKGDTLHRIVRPTQRVSHTFNYISDLYKFFRNEKDQFNTNYAVFGAFPAGVVSNETFLTGDSTTVKRYSNEFSYSFYLRPRAAKFLKNELKLDLGLQHDWYAYNQMPFRYTSAGTPIAEQYGYKNNFQNLTLKVAPGYRFSDRVNLEGNFSQIFQGRNAGDFLYEANTTFLLSKSVGRIILGAYLQNKSPEQIYEKLNYQYYKWRNNFDRTKISNLSFTYQNPKLRGSAKAEYYLLTNYLYFQESPVPVLVHPEQVGTNINLLKITLNKSFTLGKFNLDNYIVYQKTDFANVLRTPELYSYNSFYFANRFFKVLYANIGFDVRYNSPFAAPSYAANINQFYNGPDIKFANYPVADVWLRANLKRASLLLKYNYANQGLFSKGYFTTVHYPMQDALLTFGVSWKFYD